MIPSSLQRYGQTMVPSSRYSSELRAYSNHEWKGEVASLLREEVKGEGATARTITSRPRKVHARADHHLLADLKMMLRRGIHLKRRIPPHV